MFLHKKKKVYASTQVVFIECFTQQLLPNIPPTSVDNALYHNKQKRQTSTAAKDDIKRWLDKHNIEYDNKDIKKMLHSK